MSSLITNLAASKLLGGFTTEPFCVLHTGNPGAACAANVAKENRAKICSLAAAGGTRLRKNSAAVEWTEVRFKETYSFFSLWIIRIGESEVSEPLGNGELAVPVPVEVGDTARFNKEALVIEIP